MKNTNTDEMTDLIRNETDGAFYKPNGKSFTDISRNLNIGTICTK